MPRKTDNKKAPSGKAPKAQRVTREPKVTPHKAAGKKSPSSGIQRRKTPVAVVSAGKPESSLAHKKSNRHTLKSAALERGERSWELPTRYGETKAVLLARDPYWIYAYWEVTAVQLDSAKAFLGAEFSSSGTVLRVFQSTGPGGGDPLFLYDVEVRPYVTNWYLNVHHPDRNYYIEIVQRSPSGRVYTLARSNTVTTPRDFATPSPEKKWRVPDTLAKYFRQETKTQQTGISSAEVAEGFPSERTPSGKGL